MKTWFVKFSCRNTMEESLGGSDDITKTSFIRMNSWDEASAMASCMKKVDSSIYEFKNFELVNLIDESKYPNGGNSSSFKRNGNS